jgi:hypothetical protein
MKTLLSVLTRVRRTLHRLVRLFWAELRCEGYLLMRGMWRGESKFCAYHKDDGRLSFIAATTGSIFDGTIAVRHVFWNEHEPNTGVRGGEPVPSQPCSDRNGGKS